MIKLESAPALSCTTRLDLVSTGENPSIQLTTSDYQEKVGDQWMKSTHKVRQEIVSIGQNGPVTLSGVVDEPVAVQIAAAHRVVVDVALSEKLKGAFAQGRVSQAYVDVALVRVLEVYDRPGHMVYPQTTKR